MNFFAMESIMFERSNGVTNIELSATANNEIYAVLSDSDGEILNASGATVGEVLENLEKECQFFCSDYGLEY